MDSEVVSDNDEKLEHKIKLEVRRQTGKSKNYTSYLVFIVIISIIIYIIGYLLVNMLHYYCHGTIIKLFDKFVLQNTAKH